MRYYDGQPPEVMRFGSAWPQARFELVDKTTQVAPGVWLVALVSDAPGTRELKELSLAIDTPDGLVLVVGCSHPGIEAIVSAATEVVPKRVKLLAGGMHLVVAQDDVIARVVSSLRGGKVDAVAPGPRFPVSTSETRAREPMLGSRAFRSSPSCSMRMRMAATGSDG